MNSYKNGITNKKHSSVINKIKVYCKYSTVYQKFQIINSTLYSIHKVILKHHLSVLV